MSAWVFFSVKIPTRPHVGCGDVTLDPMDTHGRLDLRGCLTCGCAAYGTVLRPGSRSISHVSIFRFRSAVSAVVTQGCRFVAVSNLLFSCWKKWGVFGKRAFPSAKLESSDFLHQRWGIGWTFWKYFQVTGGFFGAALGAPGKCVRESGECQPAAVAYAKAGVWNFPGKEGISWIFAFFVLMYCYLTVDYQSAVFSPVATWIHLKATPRTT